MVSATAVYATVMFTSVMLDYDGQCSILPLLFDDKPPDDRVFRDTPTALRYTDLPTRGKLAIYVETPWMAPAEPLPQLLSAEKRKFDAKHAMIDHGGQ